MLDLAYHRPSSPIVVRPFSLTFVSYFGFLLATFQEFERGKIADTVEHFRFSRSSRTSTNFAFSRDNLLVLEMKVEGTNHWERINNYAWDVYRFRNTSTGGYLTACVGQSTYESVLHIVRGEIYPDASFVRD